MTTLEDVNRVYKCSQDASIHWHSISFKEFHLFTRAIQSLLNSIGELDNDDYWFSLIRRLRNFRFMAVAAPLSDDTLRNQLRDLMELLYAEKESFGYSHPQAFEHYHRLLTIGEGLTKIDLSKLLLAVAGELARHKHQNQTAVLVCEARFVAETEDALTTAGFREVDVLSPLFLRDDVSYKTMIVIGPTRWYPDYVFSAPRAQKILVFKYTWIRDSWRHNSVFVAPLKQRTNKIMKTVIDEPFDQGFFEPDMMLPPTLDLRHFGKRMVEESKGQYEVDYVQARLFLLEEDWVVLLDADEASSVHVIDLSDSDAPVKKIKVNDIEPGMYVLLRTAGGGDFVVQVADQIMGRTGVDAREYQRKWKRLLRSKVVERGNEKVVAELLNYGSTRANPSNIRNWMSERSIRTEYRNDFDAIMRLVGLDSEADRYWELMDYIDHAHRKAGYKIRKMLLDKVMSSDLRRLKMTGKMDFELNSENSIYITAFQVKRIFPEKLQVLPAQLGNPVRQGE